METTSISELTALWGRVLKRLEGALDKQVYETFFKDSYIHSIEGKTINVVVNSKLAAQIIPANYWQQVGDALADCSQTDYSVRYVTKDDVASGAQITPAKPAFFSDSYIKPEYTFDNFVVGESNRDAYQASLIISQNPGKLYNPVLIYGNSGLGKTHLLHAIGNTIKLKFPKYRVLYVHAQDFLNGFSMSTPRISSTSTSNSSRATKRASRSSIGSATPSMSFSSTTFSSWPTRKVPKKPFSLYITASIPTRSKSSSPATSTRAS